MLRTLIGKIMRAIRRMVKTAYYKILYRGCLQIGTHIRFMDRFRLTIAGGYLSIGNNCFFNRDCSINARHSIRIGNHCLFGEGVKIYDHNHGFKSLDVPFAAQEFTVGEVVIGDGCWVGSNVIVLKGVHIGKQCVIGAGCVIPQDIPDYSIVRMESNLCVEQHRAAPLSIETE